MDEKIGMHCHISEQKQPFRNFLVECKESGANIISITDHRTLDAYVKKIAELSNEEIEEFKNIKFVVGIEFTGAYEYVNIAGQKNRMAVDILGYNLDLKKVSAINDFVNKKYVSTDTEEFQKDELNRLISVSKSLGFKADYDKMDITDEQKFAGRVLIYGLINENYIDYNIEQGLSTEMKTNPRAFNNRYCKNPESQFYIDMTKYLPEMEEIIDLIHECGGLTFFPHTVSYTSKSGTEEQVKLAWDDSKNFTEKFIQDYKDKLDGIEIIHPSYINNSEFKAYLLDIAKENDLHVVGGTDYHQPGESICRDIDENDITKSRLPKIDEWIKTYELEEIKEIVKSIPDKSDRSEEVI